MIKSVGCVTRTVVPANAGLLLVLVRFTHPTASARCLQKRQADGGVVVDQGRLMLPE
jgi:hypothetical protein